MGIDNEAVLIYGITLNYEDVKNIEKKYDVEDIIEDIQIEVFLPLSTYTDFTSFYLGVASPYYNADETECVYFITMIKDKSLSLLRLQDLVDNWLKESWTDLLTELEIDYQDPELVALPNTY